MSIGGPISIGGTISIPPHTCQIDIKRSKLPLDLDDVNVEIGFGNSEFLVSLAKENPDEIFIGFELSGLSLEKMRRRVMREGVKNVFAIREDAFFGFHFCFKDGVVKKIYMNFPDPWPKNRHEKRRLTARNKLALFHRKLKEGGEIIIRTDHERFLNFTIEQSLGIFSVRFEEDEGERRIQGFTKYMRKWIAEGKKIYTIYLEKKGHVKDDELPPLPKIISGGESDMLLELKVKEFPYKKSELEGKTFFLRDGIYVKMFSVWERDGNMLIETLLTEHGYCQMFYLKVERKGDFFSVDVSPFSSVIRTEGVELLIESIVKGALSPL